MTFAIYAITSSDGLRFEYTINDLVGTLDHNNLANLLGDIKDYIDDGTNLLFKDLINLNDYLTANFKKFTCEQIYSKTVKDVYSLNIQSITTYIANATPHYFI